MIKYSILIITYNQKDILSRTLRSLAAQIKNPKVFEIVIADDCSTDGTDDFVKRQRLPIFLKYIRSEKNVGRSIIRNMGFEKTSGGQVLFLDGDMEPSPEMMAAYLSSWGRYPDSVIVGSWKKPPDFNYDRVMKFIMSRGRFRIIKGREIPGSWFNSGNFSIRKDIFARLSGFDLDFEGWKGEDTDFGIRLEKESIPIRYNPEAVSYHYHSKTLEETISEYERFGRTSYRVLLKKHKASRIFKNGWLLGLPDPDADIFKKTIAWTVSPFRSRPAIVILKSLAKMQGGKFHFDFCYGWLLYSCMVQSFRKPK
ncbi:MAG: glycosyltransferase family 2 protein [Candidatus Zixiibacteriota bacterium]|nr:MAG: glycosyltransferase family 2 protein [candidate division Zixibacteria bacterium]